MKSALLIIDMLSEFDFPAGATLQRAAEKVAANIATLAARARESRVPVIYVNDTRGRWESDQRAFLDRCMRGRGAGIAQLLRPEKRDYFMFKPKHSAFYGTPLAELLYMLKVGRIVVTGQSSHQCVLLTASDAHVRGLEVTVVSDCIAAAKRADTQHAAYVLEHGIGARLAHARTLRWR